MVVDASHSYLPNHSQVRDGCRPQPDDGSRCWEACCQGASDRADRDGGGQATYIGDPNPSFGLTPAQGNGECDAGSGPLAVFLAMLLLGLLAFAVLLGLGACRRGSSSSAERSWWPLGRDEQTLVVIGAASLVVVLSCVRAGYFDAIEVETTAPADHMDALIMPPVCTCADHAACMHM